MKYTVKKGDTLWSIWEKYKGKMSWSKFLEQFKKLNPGVDPDRIYAGQTVELPNTSALVQIASEHPTMYAISTFALGALFMIGALYITKKLKL